MLRMRMVVRTPSGLCHIEGAERSWEVRSVTLSGLDKRVSSVVAEPRSLGMVRYGRLEKVSVICYLETSCSSDPLRRARSRVVKDLSVYMAAMAPHRRLTLLTGSDRSLQLHGVLRMLYYRYLPRLL